MVRRKVELEGMGFAPDNAKWVLNPTWSFYQQLQEENERFLERGMVRYFSNLMQVYSQPQATTPLSVSS